MHSIDFSAVYFLESSGEERKIYNVSINVFDRNTDIFTDFLNVNKLMTPPNTATGVLIIP